MISATGDSDLRLGLARKTMDAAPNICGANAKPEVVRLSIYLGNDPAQAPARPVEPVVEACHDLVHMFHRRLLNDAKRLEAEVSGPRMKSIHLDWKSVSDTSALAIWRRGEECLAASVLLNGLETADEQDRFVEALKGEGLRLTPTAWQTIRQEERPLLTTLYYDAASMREPTIETAAVCLANAYFTMFGTSGE